MKHVLHQIAGRNSPAACPLWQASSGSSPQPGRITLEQRGRSRGATPPHPIQETLLGAGISGIRSAGIVQRGGHAAPGSAHPAMTSSSVRWPPPLCSAGAVLLLDYFGCVAIFKDAVNLFVCSSFMTDSTKNGWEVHKFPAPVYECQGKNCRKNAFPAMLLYFWNGDETYDTGWYCYYLPVLDECGNSRVGDTRRSIHRDASRQDRSKPR